MDSTSASSVHSYERGRPGYPKEAVVVDGLGFDAEVLDLGAGTGKLTRRLIETYADVVAVEPRADMRAVLVERCSAASVISGTAEAIPLDDGSVDAVFAAESFHWFDGERALAEIARVLRSGRALVVIWNLPGETTNPDLELAERLLGSRAPAGLTYDPVDLNARRYATGEWQEAFRDSEFTQPEHTALAHDQVVNADDLVSFWASMGWVDALDPREQSALFGEVRATLSADQYVRTWVAHVLRSRSRRGLGV